MSYSYSQVFTPTGSAQEHDLVGVYGYSSWDQMEPSDGPPAYIKEAVTTIGFTSPQDYMAKRDILRDIVRSEIWRRVAGTTPTENSAPKAGDWIILDYIKTQPQKGSDYDTIWKAYSLPIQEERVKAGKIKSYSMWSVPGAGTESNYDRVALLRYASFKDIGYEPPTTEVNASAEKSHAGKD